MRVMALDVGTVRVGVALSDESRLIASPLETIDAKPIKAAITRIKALVAEHNVAILVVGMPFDLDGVAGRAARRTERFIKHLTKAITAIPIERWDERMSSVAAERVLLEGDVRRKDRKMKIDKVAAAWILQGYLGAHPNEVDPW